MERRGLGAAVSGLLAFRATASLKVDARRFPSGDRALVCYSRTRR